MITWDDLAEQVRTAAERTERQYDRGGFRATTALDELDELRALIRAMADQELIRAREQRAPFAMLGPTRQAAQQRYAGAVRRSS